MVGLFGLGKKKSDLRLGEEESLRTHEELSTGLSEIKKLINNSFRSANDINNILGKIQKQSKKLDVTQKNYIRNLVRLNGYIFSYYADMKGRKYKRMIRMEDSTSALSLSSMPEAEWNKLNKRVGTEIQKLAKEIEMVLKYEKEFRKAIENHTKIFSGDNENAGIIKNMAEIYVDLNIVRDGSIALMNALITYYDHNYGETAQREMDKVNRGIESRKRRKK